jgi:hypothetical protein
MTQYSEDACIKEREVLASRSFVLAYSRFRIPMSECF